MLIAHGRTEPRPADDHVLAVWLANDSDVRPCHGCLKMNWLIPGTVNASLPRSGA